MKRLSWPLVAILLTLTFGAFATAAPPVNAFQGVFWQPDCHTLSRLSNYRNVGAEFVVVQWTENDHEDYSGQGNSACRLDWADVQRRSGQLPLIVGLKGATNPSPEQLPQLAQASVELAERIKLLSLNPTPLGYYAPVELNPIWPADKVRAYLQALPRPLWVSAYAVPGQLGPDFVKWLREAVPNDVHLMVQDGVGVHSFAPNDVAAIVRELQGYYGADHVSVVVEVFRPFPVGRFRSVLPWELNQQFNAYRGLSMIAFDGGHYMGRVWQEFFRLYHWWRGLRNFTSPSPVTRNPYSFFAGGPS